jgi:ribosomal protein L11 methyltransferase
MQFTEVSVLCPQGWQETVAGILACEPCRQFVYEPEVPEGVRVHTAVATEKDTPELRSELRERLANLGRAVPELAHLELAFELIEARDISAAWRASLRAFRLGRLAVLPPWSEAPTRPEDRILRIQPGIAFGTGRHVTTRACLRLMQELVRDGDRVLDAGTGSGILAVSSCLFGAGFALGVDPDPYTRAVADELAQDNGVQERCEFRTGGFEVLSSRDGDFDLVFANLYADLILRHASELAVRLRPNARLVVSGIARERVAAVFEALHAQGLRVEGSDRRTAWCTLLAVPDSRQPRPQ